MSNLQALDVYEAYRDVLRDLGLFIHSGSGKWRKAARCPKNGSTALPRRPDISAKQQLRPHIADSR